MRGRREKWRKGRTAMNLNEIQALDDECVLHTYGRLPVALDHGKGCEAWDTEGKHYYDFTSGIGVNAFGYCDDGWVKAVTEQAGRIQHMSNYYYCEKNALLAAALQKASGMGRAFFCNSGAEANECAVKVARRFGEKKGAHKIVTLKNSFHGRTITTLAANGQDAFHEYFLPLTEGFVYAEANDIADLEQKLDGTVCAVLLESVQGEGGVIPLDTDYLRAVRRLCDERGALLMLDEVQTGVGRTGYFFSYQGCGVQPDVVTAASAGALEMVTRIDDAAFLAAVREKGEYFRAALSKLEGVEYVRGRGLMLGIKLKNRDAHDVMEACARAGLLILTAKSLVRFLPPLTITKEEIDAGLRIFAEQIKG